jgi:hypothetical protein
MTLVFNESDFRSRVDRALERVKTILDNTRKPQVRLSAGGRLCYL